VLKRWATLPKISVIAARATSSRLVSSPASTLCCRGPMNSSTAEISGRSALFLISLVASMTAAPLAVARPPARLGRDGAQEPAHELLERGAVVDDRAQVTAPICRRPRLPRLG
jgi:hypothetical protein